MDVDLSSMLSSDLDAGMEDTESNKEPASSVNMTQFMGETKPSSASTVNS